MKLETFFEKFDELSDTPNGVKQLRELVLQLAVEGGLVPHSAAEPAVPYASLEDVAPINVSDVPENWRVVLLADAIKNRSGNSKLIKGKLQDEPAAGRFQGFSASGANVWCDGYEHEGQAIIISAVGARCGKAFKASGKWCAIANTNITRPEPSLFDFDFAYLVLNNEHFWVRGGSAQPFVKFPPSLDRHFALPPLAEQKRIVAKVNELMALCDRLEAQQQERGTRHAALARASLARFADAPTPANLNLIFHSSYSIPPADLRKSILTLAVQGKLVPQDPNDEPAEELFAKLEKERRRFADAHKFRAPVGEPVDDSSVPFTIPKTWKWCRLSLVFNAVTDGDHLPPPKSDSGIAFLTIGNITTGTLDFEGSRFVPDSYYRGLADFRRPIRGDILYTVVGATYGRPALVESDRPFCVQRHIAILKPPQLVDVGFLMAVLRSPLAYDQASASTTGTAQPTIPLGSLRNFAVPLPPLAEQRRIVAKVEQLMALVDALETQLAASRATAANLLSALVAELTTA